MKKARRYSMTVRSAKAAATRARICDSMVALYGERSFDDFTLDDVARRAGTTVQTILRVFKSKDNLAFEVLNRMAGKDSPYRMTRPGGFTPTSPGDIAAAVTAVFSAYEIIGDLVIRNLNDERRNPALTPILAAGRQHHRDWVRAVFAPQLKARRGNMRAELFNCLIVATDVYTWKILRRDLNLTRPGAEAVVRQLVAAVTREKSNVALPMAELVRRRQSAA
jgi:AcrR family transcriptional regulator